MKTLSLDTISVESETNKTETQYTVGEKGTVHIISKDGEADDEADEYYYGIDEPELTEIERFALRETEQAIRDEFSINSAEDYSPEDLQAVCEFVGREYMGKIRLNISHLKDAVFDESVGGGPTLLIRGEGKPVGAPSAENLDEDTKQRIIITGYAERFTILKRDFEELFPDISIRENNTIIAWLSQNDLADWIENTQNTMAVEEYTVEQALELMLTRYRGFRGFAAVIRPLHYDGEEPEVTVLIESDDIGEENTVTEFTNTISKVRGQVPSWVALK